ncbi:hypothetical protein PUN28_003155 [Cardiocondyla obscurior]|uniref:Uncharacterized protein n=1 Tax=Cardiocondyla obscurior TaxID=286306 RepID=A0AAW2GMI2_9HYME
MVFTMGCLARDNNDNNDANAPHCRFCHGEGSYMKKSKVCPDSGESMPRAKKDEEGSTGYYPGKSRLLNRNMILYHWEALPPYGIGTLIAGRYIGEVLREEFFRTPARVLEKRVFWDNRIVSDSLLGLSGLAAKEKEKEMQQAEEKAMEEVHSKEGGKRG